MGAGAGVEPGALEDLVSRRRAELTGDEEWTPLEVVLSAAPAQALWDAAGRETPEFGVATPTFGYENSAVAREVVGGLGRGRALRAVRDTWPRFPVCVLDEHVRQDIRVGELLGRPCPTSPIPCEIGRASCRERV